MSTAADKAQLRWRCRRGMRELDLLLDGWLQCHYDQATDAEQKSFRSLLEADDPTLIGWLTGREQNEDPVLGRLIDAIRDHHH